MNKIFAPTTKYIIKIVPEKYWITFIHLEWIEMSILYLHLDLL